MTGERDRQAILARRRFFVASALASGLATTHCDKAAQPCLEVAPSPSVDATAPPLATPAESAPQPCLEVAPPPPSEDASAGKPVPAPTPTAAEKPEPAPRPCLKIALPPELQKKR